MYRPNLITNDGFINHHQKAHCDFKVTFPNVIMKLSAEKKKNKSKTKKYIFNI